MSTRMTQSNWWTDCVTARSESSRRQWVPRGAMLATLAWLLVAPLAGVAEDTSLEARQARLKERVVAALKSGDVAGLYVGMDEYRALEKEGAKVPPGLFFAEAEAARASNDFVRAERAFGDYFRVATPEGDTYGAALRAYPEFRSGIPEPIMSTFEDMVPIPGGTPVAGDGAQVKPFSIGRHEVTRAQFLAFVDATGYRPSPPAAAGDDACGVEQPDWRKPGFEQTAADPVVCVSWNDAKAYIDWLNQWSSLKFRLPTDAEWEYAARAGTPTAYWYGAGHDANMSNGQGAAERDKWALGTAPVGQFPANPFGLFDILGNASEWVADCAEPGREDAGGCEARLVRGGNWTSDAAQLQVTVRAGKPRTFRANYIGFRLASGS